MSTTTHESAIRVLLHIRNARGLSFEVRFLIARHISAIRLLRSAV